MAQGELSLDRMGSPDELQVPFGKGSLVVVQFPEPSLCLRVAGICYSDFAGSDGWKPGEFTSKRERESPERRLIALR